MLYNRHELVELIQREPKDLQPLLTAIIWLCSRSQAQLIEGNRYGLCQVDLTQAQAAGFKDQPNKLLEPPANIHLAALLLQRLGLVVYLGREMAGLIPQILQLAEFLQHA